nr:MAG TPA: hypothetical protein [Herelleviridae sp.]
MIGCGFMPFRLTLPELIQTLHPFDTITHRDKRIFCIYMFH